MGLPGHVRYFLEDALGEGVRESLLSTARKNGKSRPNPPQPCRPPTSLLANGG